MPIFQPPPLTLAQELGQSQIWYQTSGSEGMRAALTLGQYQRLNLAGVTLVDAVLQEANFDESCLDDALVMDALANGLSLKNARFIGCNFTKAALVGAEFNRSVGHRAIFRKAQLNQACFDDGDFREAEFHHAVCIEASFLRADLRGADFSDASLMTAILSYAKLEGANFTNARLTQDTRLEGVTGLDKVIASRIFMDYVPIEGDLVLTTLQSLQAAL